MIITTPVTDYIPASLLTQNGDIVTRVSNVVTRMESQVFGMVKRSSGSNLNLGYMYLSGILGHYLKGAGETSNSVFTPLALRDTGIHISSDTRNTAGDQIITGVGFEASAIIFLAVDDVSSDINHSIGYDNGTIGQCFAIHDNGTVNVLMAAYSIYIRNTVGNFIRGVISAISANGFTITWYLTGTRGCYFSYLCLP